MEGHYKPTKADLVKVERTFSDAFYDYPLHKYIVPDDDIRKKLLPKIFKVTAVYGYKFGNMVITSENCEGVMLYAPSNEHGPTITQLLKCGALSLVFTRWNVTWLWRFNKVSRIIDKIRKKNAPVPHIYVAYLAVHPAHQGKGYARRLLVPLLKKAGEDHVPCYLETFEAKNVEIYKRIGFKLREECTIPGTPLILYSMLWRPTG
ncbi:MAG: GNAT family N-acetyltransferase [Candidatus Sigynarchaeota archaeon]